MQGERQVPALLRAKVIANDDMNMSKVTGMKTGYMVLDEFERELGAITAKVFATESSCKTYSQGQQVIKVDVIRKFD